MNRAPFTLEIHPRAWYALANLPKDVYERLQQGLAVVADNAANHSRAARGGGDAAPRGSFVTLDGYRARYELQPARGCLCVLAVERPGEWTPEPAPREPVAPGAAAPSRNTLVGAAPAARPEEPPRDSAPPPTSAPEEA